MVFYIKIDIRRQRNMDKLKRSIQCFTLNHWSNSCIQTNLYTFCDSTDIRIESNMGKLNRAVVQKLAVLYIYAFGRHEASYNPGAKLSSRGLRAFPQGWLYGSLRI